MRKLFGSLLLIVTVGCGGGGGTTTPSQPLIQVAGTYPTAVALVENDCGDVTVLPMTTTVIHNPGATQLSLVHANTTYGGSLSGDGTFMTNPLDLPDSNGGTLTVGISGRFETNGFEAMVAIDVRRTNGSRCRYVVRWTGTKQGPPNVIP
jgi:hypothetical protein